MMIKVFKYMKKDEYIQNKQSLFLIIKCNFTWFYQNIYFFVCVIYELIFINLSFVQFYECLVFRVTLLSFLSIFV